MIISKSDSKREIFEKSKAFDVPMNFDGTCMMSWVMIFQLSTTRTLHRFTFNKFASKKTSMSLRFCFFFIEDQRNVTDKQNVFWREERGRD
jgi:hypothetical protein